MYQLDMGRRGGILTGNGQEMWFSDRTWVEDGVLTGHGRRDSVLAVHGHQRGWCTDWTWAGEVEF